MKSHSLLIVALWAERKPEEGIDLPESFKGFVFSTAYDFSEEDSLEFFFAFRNRRIYR
jgi:hypothetical protein